MASMRIPKKYHAGFAKFLSLPEQSIQRLISFLEGTPLTPDFRGTLRKAVSAVETIPASNVQDIAEALVSLYLVRARKDDATPDFVNKLAQAIEESDSKELHLPDEFREKIRPRLIQLLEVNSIALASRVVSVMSEHGNIFREARMLTDIRPVFGVRPEAPQAAVIVHNLRIHYHQGGAHRDFLVTMDSQDIQDLIDTLERAKVKAENLKVVLATAGIPYIEPE